MSGILTQDSIMPGDPAATLPIPRVLLADYPSRNITIARQWLSECAADHNECPGDELVQLPTRLVEVSPPGAPESAHLRFTGGQEGRYAALSYCWGGPQPFQTVTACLEAYSAEIPCSHVPKTILDAFEVTRNLGLQYIWIDSLCIVQDDEEDKNRELPQMRRIYENSVVTISAASATSCYQGFLDPRPNKRSPRHISVRVDDTRLGSVLAVIRQETLEFDWISQPINDRAWTLQEAWVAPRLLVFAGMAIFWKCARPGWQYWRPWRSDWLESRDSGSGSTDPYAELVNGLKSTWAGYSGYVEEGFARARDKWESVVEQYTGRALTLDRDKLPAISAVAETLSPFLGGGYLAGLWRQHLMHDLLWCVAGAEPRFTGHGPTWSWASNTGRIRFPAAERNNPSQNLVASASIVDCSVVLASEGVPYGAVESGELVIEGYMADLSQMRSAGLRQVVWDDPGRYNDLPEGQGFLDSQVKAPIEASEHAFPSVSYWTLTIATATWRGRNDRPSLPKAVFGLILAQSVLAAGLFRRVGFFALAPQSNGGGSPSRSWEGLGRRVVKIV
jgi:hypothetical protein